MKRYDLEDCGFYESDRRLVEREDGEWMAYDEAEKRIAELEALLKEKDQMLCNLDANHSRTIETLEAENAALREAAREIRREALEEAIQAIYRGHIHHSDEDCIPPEKWMDCLRTECIDCYVARIRALAEKG